MKYVIIAALAAYLIFAVVKKVRDVKKGKYCDCGCENCPHSKECKK